MKKIVFLLAVIYSVTLICPFEVYAQEGKFVLFIMDGVDLVEIKDAPTPNLDLLIKQGAIALTNSRTAGSLEPKDTYLSIGAGDRARAGNSAYLNFNFNERYQGNSIIDFYNTRIALSKRNGQIFNLELPKIKRSNQNSAYQAQVGRLAEKLRVNDLKISVLGNADIWQQPRRHVAMIGINKYGIIKQGDVGQRMRIKTDQDPSFYRTNQDYLIQKFLEYRQSSDLIIIESGDTSRLEAVKNDLSVKKFKVEKQEAIVRSDRLLGKIMDHLDFKEEYLFLIVPTPSKQGKELGDNLTLSILEGPNITGVLSSATTRRASLITNLDIVPTICSYLDISSSYFTGNPVKVLEINQSLDDLMKLNYKIKTTFAWRPILIKGFILLQIITLALVALILLKKGRLLKLKKIAKYLVLLLLWIPTLFLFSKLFLTFDIVSAILLILFTAMILTYLVLKLNKLELIHILFISLATFIILVIDIFTGANLIKISVLGYSPVIGARFYGIGNEFMGIIIGAGVISIMILKELKPQVSDKLLLLLFILLILTVGFPNLGANFGGLITSTVACSISYFYLKSSKLDLRSLIKLILVLLVVITLIFMVDLFSNNQSHLGKTLNAIKEGGVNKLILILYRKISMNVKLLRWTIWTRVLIAFVIILIILLKRPRGVIKDIADSYPSLVAAIKALVIASVVTMIVNDSGVVAAATLLLFPIFSLLYLVLNRIAKV